MIIDQNSGQAASASKKVQARLIDFGLAFALLVASAMWTVHHIFQNGTRIGAASDTLQFKCFMGAFASYYVVFYLFTGRTPGMALLGLGRVRSNGKPAGWLHSWLACVVILAAIVYVPGRLFFPLDPTQKLRSDAWGALSQIALALSEYYGDHDGHYPKTLEDPEFRKLLPQIPLLDLGLPGQAPSDKVEIYSFGIPPHDIVPAKMRNTGHWAYDPKTGSLAVDSALIWVGEPAYKIGN